MKGFTFVSRLLLLLLLLVAAGTVARGFAAQSDTLAVFLPLVTNGAAPLPLHVGLAARWDGTGYLDIGEHYEPGTHVTTTLDAITAPDVIRARNHGWYDPDPLAFGESFWDSFYAVSTGAFISSTVPANPAWKWGHPWLLPYDVTFTAGQTTTVDGQLFLVSGPHAGTTAFGAPVQYWELVNQARFLYFDDGGEWTQYVEAGDAILRYDAGHSRLLLHRDILRHYYQNGVLTDQTVQYVEDLTAASSFAPTTSRPGVTPADATGAPRSQRPLPALPGLEPGPAGLAFEIAP